MSQPCTNGYSAQVRLGLVLGEQRFPLSHVEPDRIRLRKSVDLPPQNGTVVIEMDGEEQVHAVFLPDGITTDNPVVRIVVTEPRPAHPVA